MIIAYTDISLYEVVGKNKGYIETLEDRYVTLSDVKGIITKEQIKINMFEV